ncbi:hypothetical protein [Carboxylicivirga marina]|uniref:hypothetical protein n=1 Tax=Carboxylicivirga marina TaxID=2800988 RepID=UPI00259905F2|nr:hypothetical protein [uncultured Carboxylicivirga sp.]
MNVDNLKHSASMLVFILLVSFGCQQDIEKQPITPKEWLQKMGNGNWMIFNIPPKHTGFADVSFEPQLLDSLKSRGITGGRLHLQAREMIDPHTHLLDSKAVDFVSTIIDELTSRDMAVCLQYDCLLKEERYYMGQAAKNKYFKSWRQLCTALKDKDYLLAMCPTIHFQGWDYLYDQFKDTQDSSHLISLNDSTNRFYDDLTKIFRESNPKRIISYRMWFRAGNFAFEDLDLPYDGNSSNPDEAYYMVSGMMGYGIGHWEDYGVWNEYSLNDLKHQLLNNDEAPKDALMHAINWSNKTGIEFWVDRWEPNYWKYGEWTQEQNLEFVKCLLDTLKDHGIASCGIQTRRIWDSKNMRFKNDEFTQQLLKVFDELRWE